MERSKRRSPGQWAEIVGEQERSGRSVRDFCEGRSIGLASFYQWRRRVRDTGPGSDVGVGAKGSFIDMGQIGSSGDSASAGGRSLVVTLDLGEGATLTVRRG